MNNSQPPKQQFEPSSEKPREEVMKAYKIVKERNAEVLKKLADA